MKIKEDLMEILNDHKSNLIVMVDETDDGGGVTDASQYEALIKDIEIEHDRMITEVNELLGSSYD